MITADKGLIGKQDVEIQFIDKLVSDRNAFNDFVYTSLESAQEQLDIRKNDLKLKEYINSNLTSGVPEIFASGKLAVLFRQIATPNYEVRRFVSIVDALGKEYKPLFFEYTEDKFTDNNEWKYNLCKMSFFAGKGKKGGSKIERLNIIDFNSCRGKKLSEIVTIWGQKLTDFHRELVVNTYSHLDKNVFYDASGWFVKSGGNAKEYYAHFLRLFLQNGILFENFMLNDMEISFTKEVFLPALIRIRNESGKKPLIVALEPTDIEGDNFWMCHPHESIGHIKDKLKLI
jgi:hypothetical protein